MSVITAAVFRKGSKRRKAAKINMGGKLRAELEKQMGVIGFALHELMTRSKVPQFIGKDPVELDPEQGLAVEVADMLRALTLQYYETEGKIGLRAVWCHVANERQASWFTMLLLRAMGMLAGAQDYWFAWEGGSGLIELKVDGDLTEAQVHFRNWAGAFEVNNAVCRKLDDVREKLIQWGAVVGIEGKNEINAE